MIRGGRGSDRKKIVTKILLIMIKVVLVLVNHIGHSMYVLEGVNREWRGEGRMGGVSSSQNSVKYD